MLKLFLISQNETSRWDTYNSAVVVAETEEEAKLIHPSGKEDYPPSPAHMDWASSPDNVTVVYLGILSPNSVYVKGEVICSDFNAA